MSTQTSLIEKLHGKNKENIDLHESVKRALKNQFNLNELLAFYHEELKSLKNEALFFAKENPELAENLGIQKNQMEDPLVKHLIEAFAFLSARTKQQFSKAQDQLIHSILKLVAPHSEYPYPAMSVAQFCTKESEAEVPRGAELILNNNQGKFCEFKSCYSTNPYPFEIINISYEKTNSGSQLSLDLSSKTSALPIKLKFYINLVLSEAFKLYGLLFSKLISIEFDNNSILGLDNDLISEVGFTQDESVLPYPTHILHSHRILNEFFTYPQKFLFFDLKMPEKAVESIKFNFSTYEDSLRSHLSKESLLINCSPIINLHECIAEPIPIKNHQNQYPLLLNKSNQNSQILYSIESVEGINRSGQIINFNPLFKENFKHKDSNSTGFWELHRALGENPKREIDYLISLSNHADKAISTLSIKTLCCNKNIPTELMSQKTFNLSFKNHTIPNINAIRCMMEPSEYKDSLMSKNEAFKLAQHLNINYMSNNEENQLAILKELFSLYNQAHYPAIEKLMNDLKDLKLSSQWIRDTSGFMMQIQVATLSVSRSSETAFCLFEKIIKQLLESYAGFYSIIKTRVNAE